MKQTDGPRRIEPWKIHIAIILGVMIVIFAHSAMPGEESFSESRTFVDILASVTGLSLPVAEFIVRKTAHLLEFMVLGICLIVACYDLQNLSDLNTVKQNSVSHFIALHPQLSAWIIGTLYACTDEMHQLFAHGRNSDFMDICIDSAGVILGILCYRAYRRLTTKRVTGCVTGDGSH